MERIDLNKLSGQLGQLYKTRFRKLGSGPFWETISVSQSDVGSEIFVEEWLPLKFNKGQMRSVGAVFGIGRGGAQEKTMAESIVVVGVGMFCEPKPLWAVK